MDSSNNTSRTPEDASEAMNVSVGEQSSSGNGKVEEKQQAIVETPNDSKEVRRGRMAIRRSLSMITSPQDSAWDNSPFLATIEKRIQGPILSFGEKNMLLNTKDENESPSTLSLSFKRPVAFQRTPSSFQSKRSRSLYPKNMNTMNINTDSGKAETRKCNPEVEEIIKKAVQKADEDANLIGDFTKPYALPLILNSKHQDLKSITAETLAALIKGEFNEQITKYSVIDCRYPYEYDGGHIIGAKNIYLQEHIVREFFDEKKVSAKSGDEKRSVIIFHCEFSSERGPTLYRFLRSRDREKNREAYPTLDHPEIYLLHGGYKAFFEKFKELCDPQQYLPMSSKDHKYQCRQFRMKSKSWNCENKFAAIASDSQKHHI